MMSQEKVKTYRESDIFADGISMRPPPAGTVPRERVIDPAIETGRNPDETPVARIPVQLTRELLETGRKRFEITCAACHGLVGDGKSLVARNMSLRKPPSLHDYASRPDGYLFQVISEGFGLMPSYAGELEVEERWAVVAYVRALQISQRTRLAQVPPDVRARLEKEP
jgi:mono/diheme cytochrome c family protein